MMQTAKIEPLIVPHDKPTHILARLELGFRTDSAHLRELEKDLTEALQHARHFGGKHGSPDDWNTDWHQQWDIVEAILRRTRVLVNEMSAAIESSETDRLEKALAAWDTLQSENAGLVEALSAIRTQVGALSGVIRKDWNLLARALESHLETFHACTQTLRIRLELSKNHSREEVDHLVRDILAKLPNRLPADGMSAESYDQEYRNAATELEQERHKFQGFMDVVKGLLIWVETPEERVGKNLSLRVDET